jgi:ornithine decarboxylase
VPPDRLIYGTAVKPTSHIQQMAAYGVRRFAADSSQELHKIAAIVPDASIYLRVAVDDAGSVFSMSNKFGAHPDEVAGLAQLANSLGLDCEGLSFNVGSQAPSARAWSRAIATVSPLFAALRDQGVPVRLLNLGGGLPVTYADRDTPSPDTVAATVREALRRLPYQPQELILEPGRALVANAFDLHTSVVGRARRGSQEWLFLEAGAYNALFEALACQGRTRYPAQPGSDIGGELREFALAGPTGDGLDVVADSVMLPSNLAEGDELILRRVGAYTVTMASPFNGFPVPPVIPLASELSDVA